MNLLKIQKFSNIWSSKIIGFCETVFNYHDKDFIGKYRKLNSCKQNFVLLILRLGLPMQRSDDKGYRKSFL